MAIRVLIAEHDPALRTQMKEIIGSEGTEVVGLARDGQEAIQMAMQLSPHIAFVTHDLPGLSGIQTCEMLSALAPDIMCVLVSDVRSQDRVDSAIHAGARAVIAKPLDAAQVGTLIVELAEVRKRRESADLLDWKDPSKFPKAISITGAKGGVGKSTIAVNVAVVLAKHFPNKVALLDLYTQFGDIAAMMNVVPKYTLGDLVPVSKDLDTELIQNYITKHASGVHVLVSSVEPIPLDVITAECLDSVLYVLKRMYRYIIVDVPPILHPATLHVLAHSNVILLIANLFDLTTATDTKKLYDALQSEHISRDNIKLVLNRVSKVNRLHTADIEQMFDCSILAHIPNDGRLVNSVNQGIPLAMSDGASPLGRSFIRLAASITGSTDEVAAVQAASLKKRLFKSKKGK